ncbi:uncharacterized protein LOC128445608 [Pleuronectes platessa]|uniref:uncharacterized protein LOC128445608 n=1 Tax=Pleuronectes platessa TaxID=8262 RepID=UPI00232A25CB|nr:uncharacterized protein LOC128445608 [Pleuronectes platessa]
MKEDYMEQFLILLVMLAAVSHVAETKFSVTQNTSLYSLTPGGHVSIQIINNASGHQVVCKKQLPTRPVNVFTLWRGKVTIYEGFRNRTQFFINNGTLEFTNVAKNDSGQYIMEAFDSNGVLVGSLKFQLDVQEQKWSSILIPASVGAAAVLLLLLVVLVCFCVCKRRKTSDDNCLQSIFKNSTCVETKCDVRQKDGAQCYGALGGAVDLQLMDRTPERLTIYKNYAKILIWSYNTIRVNINPDKYSFTPSDGMLRIDNLIRSDTDEYRLQIRSSDGALLEKWTLQLSIQAPVSSVRLVTECLSQGEMRVSCSSEGGDSPQYSWSLDGHTLTEDKLLSGNHETDNITLRQYVEGVLVCSVKNHVSHFEKYQRISTCVFINCTAPNETLITQWVFAANNTLCVEPTSDTTVGKKTAVIVSLKPSISITSSNQTVTSSFRDEPWFINPSLICGLQTAVAALLFIGIAAYFAWRKNKSKRAEGSAVPQEREDPETSV